MKSPFGWCLMVVSLVAGWNTTAIAQYDESVLNPGDLLVGTEPATGFRFQADALYWTLHSPRNDAQVIGGPESFSQGSLSNSFTGGYRLGAAWLIDPNYEVEGVWTQFSNWTANGGGTLSRAISFNDGQASTLVDPSGNANFINTGTFFRPIYDAATDPVGQPAIQNYAFLKPGSVYSEHTSSTLNDLQANFKTRRNPDQRFSYGLGYRNIRLAENSNVDISGDFGTNDLPGGGNTHNTLSDQALTSHGLTLMSGAGDGFTNPTGSTTTLSMLWSGATRNEMNGMQGTLDAMLLEYGGLSLEGLIRAGLFYNRMTGSVQEVYAAGGADNSVYGRSLTDQRDTLSFAGNAGLNGVYQVSNHLRFRLGYEAMFLSNQAVAGYQQQGITYNSLGRASYSVQGGSTVILHGARVGLEVLW